MDECSRRRRLAERIAPAYAANPKVAAVLLAGSVARGTADRFSDIEIDVYWHQPPSDADRMAPILANNWELLYQHVDDYEWADGFYIAGVKVDTSQFLVSTLDQWIADVVERADMEVEKQIRITALQHAQPLATPALIEHWRAQAEHYPAALQHAMLTEHLWFKPRMELEMLAARDNALLLHRNVHDASQRIMDVLHALNELYLPHPYHKWLDWEIERMAIAPPQLAERLRSLLRAAPEPSVAQLHALIEEVFALVEQHLPGYDTSAARAEFGIQRVKVS